MMTDYVNSFFSNMKEKVSNPFLGTIILVVLLRYWEVFYALFTFDDDCDMLAKQSYIHNYFATKDFWEEMGCIVLDSFAVLIVTYCLIALSGLIVKFFNKQIISRTDKITDKNSVKTLAEYQALEKSFADTFEKLRKTTNDNIELELRVSNLRSDISSKETEISKITIESDERFNSMQELIGKLDIEKTSKNDLRGKVTNLEGSINLQQQEIESLNSNLELQKRLINPIENVEYQSPNELRLRSPKFITETFDQLANKKFVDSYLALAPDLDIMPSSLTIGSQRQYNVYKDLGLIHVVEGTFVNTIEFTWKGEHVFKFIKAIEGLKKAYLDNNFTEFQKAEFSTLPMKKYSDEFSRFRSFGNCMYIPADFKLSNEFQEFLVANFYISYNKGFLEFTNKGLKMINYLQNIYY